MKPALKLNNGLEMPLLGYGTFLSKPNEVKEGVKTALKVGYRHLDCARVYRNEKEIGEALKEVFADPSYNLKREDIWITSKLPAGKMKPEDVEPTCREALSDLGLSYLDLFLVHLPIAVEIGPDSKVTPIRVPLHKTWEAMEALVDKGLVKAIGVSNYTTSHINDLLAYARIKPTINQIERHPYLVQPAHVKFCQDNGIHITAYSSLGAPAFHDGKPFPSLLKDPVINEIAKKHNKAPSQVLLRWSLDGQVIAIPKSVTPERIAENFNIFDFKLDENDMARINGLDKHLRGFTQSWAGVPFLEN